MISPLAAPEPSIKVSVQSEDQLLREVVAAALASREGLQMAPVGGERRVSDQGAGGDGATGVVLIDAARDRQWALSRTREARERWPGARVIVIGLEEEDASVVDFAEAGAQGYVLAGAGPEELAAVIRSVHRGCTPCSPRVAAAAVARIAALSRAQPPGPALREVVPLTAREREILFSLADGLGNKEIGRRLGITVQTVKNHVHRILEKLQVHRRREAVRLAYDLALLPEPPGVPEGGDGMESPF
jgi:two-component system NarL family response regulator